MECHRVGVNYDGVSVLRNINWDVRPGEVHGVVGSNGAGKSTLMKVLAGAVPHYDGEIRVNGQPVQLSSPRAALSLGIAMIYQELSGVGQLSVAENLCLGRQPLTRWGTVDWLTMNRQAEAALAELEIQIDVRRRLDSYPLVIRQMVEIARGLHSGAEILILDEPTSALSLPEARKLFELMQRLRQRGVAMVFISHFLEDVLAICDRVTTLRDGNRVDTQPAQALNRTSLIERMVGHSEDAVGEETTSANLPAPSAAAVRLTVTDYSRAGLFQEIALQVRAGECLGLYGFVGAGHQELVQSLAGAMPTESGAVQLDGRPLRPGDVPTSVRSGVVLVAADRARTIARRAPVAHNTTLAHLSRTVGRWLTRSREEAACQPVLTRTSCRPANPRLAAGLLSGGNQQKVVFARWLLGPIRVLLLEEPTRGMDVHAKSEVMALAKEQQQAGAAVILASTEPELVLAHADRILTLSRGRITREFHSGHVTRQDLLHAAE